jgi:hypothetical protein
MDGIEWSFNPTSKRIEWSMPVFRLLRSHQQVTWGDILASLRGGAVQLDSEIDGPLGMQSIRRYLATKAPAVLKRLGQDGLSLTAFSRVLRSEAPQPLCDDLEAQLNLYSALNTSGSGVLTAEELSAGVASVTGQDAFLMWIAHAAVA